jgi:hypothetical protein
VLFNPQITFVHCGGIEVSNIKKCKVLLWLFLFAIVLVFNAPIASASDTDVVFEVTGTFVPGSVSFLSNSAITIDITNGTIVSEDLALSIPGAVFLNAPSSDPSFLSNGFLFSDSNGDQLGIGILPLTGTLIGYTGGSADGALLTFDPLYAGANLTGTLELTDPLPQGAEPASMLLFGTGLIGIGVLVRRRSAAPRV